MEMNQKKMWSFIGIFMITLIVTLPFYSADALAVSLQITKNSGSAGMEGFIDAKGDTWSVEALISGTDNATSVEAKDVKIKINDNQKEFGSCSDDALGKICKYTSPLSDGVKEVEYKFQVFYSYTNAYGITNMAADESVIKSDGSAPKVTNLEASQDPQGKVHLNFDVSDRYEGKPFVGIKSIEIIDADTNTVLEKKDDFVLGVAEFNYASDGGTQGILDVPLSGEGFKHLQVKAEDWFGHKTVNPPSVNIYADFVAPVIVKESLNFSSLGKFKGPVDVNTPLTLDVHETNSPMVTATASGTNLDDSQAECSVDPLEEGLYHCIWDLVEINGDAPDPLSVQITARDLYGNTVQETLTQSFVLDNAPPEVIYFGAERRYEGQEYISAGPQRIYLRVRDQGVGMDISGVRADLQGIGGVTSAVPDNCTDTPESFNCYWDIDAEVTTTGTAHGTAHLVLSRLQDRVGNVGSGAGVDLKMDDNAPKVQKIEFYGVSEGLEHDYFQSNDQIKIKAYLEETSGVRILVNLNDLVMDAADKYSEDEKTVGYGEGWVAFDESNCVRGKEGRWECEIETDSIRSGPEQNIPLIIAITDTAGNAVEEWIEAKNVELGSGEVSYRFDLLGKSEEANPDYWEVVSGYPKKGLDFVDLDTTPNTYTRMPVQIQFRSPNSQAGVLSAELIPNSCEAKGTAPEISRALTYGGNYPQGDRNPSLTLMLEFSPFDGRNIFATSSNPTFSESTAEYTCKVKIYSLVGSNALAAGEVQEVIVKVPFAFSKMGALDENLADKIDAAWNTDFMKFANALHYVNQAIIWVKFILNAVMIINSVVTLFTEIQDLWTISALSVENSGLNAAFGAGEAIGAALRGQCSVMQASEGFLHEILPYIQIPLQILSCTPYSKEYASLGWYADYQQSVLNIYNTYTGRGAFVGGKGNDISSFGNNPDVPGLGVPATSLYDNLYLSIIGLCVPGVIYNLEKVREIHCRKIVCYGREVPQGIATIESCNDLFDLQMCEYVYGPMMDLVPFLGALSQIGQMIKSMFTSPVGLINAVEILGCGVTCFVKSPGLVKACNWVRQLTKLLDIIESVIGVIKQPPSVTGSPYCDMAKSIDKSKLTGGSEYGQLSAPEQLPTASTTSTETSNPYAYTEATTTTEASS